MKQLGFTLLAFAFLMVATVYSQLNSITAASTIPVSKTTIKTDNLESKMFMAPWVELCEEEEEEEEGNSQHNISIFTKHEDLKFLFYSESILEAHVFQPFRLTYPHLQTFSPPPDMRG
ncbi:hypothetical protein [Aquirufa aurantiipilula]|uniref:Uncharacterized protein n=1 Tax=Aquirufa aurantiipilula TaxID=2696561 RepID=A0ABT6BKS1_9BACT|nr:hypothetical protein [Aquirufa aurantiipilula]MBZ1327365.1 hypothetical protein [Aquirufa aurantiipilula]MDF5690955.1 hypothetical protein [Aquirufa aurantiipilula]